ncbi:MAG: RsmD family RNA methyltransferase, partial [Bryobacteraceae bacterium]
VFLDAYAGSGAVGIEALSRGARRAIFIERSRGAVNIIRENLASLQIADRAEILAGKTLSVLPRAQADIVFIDPPYSLEREYREVLELLGDWENCFVIAQHAARFELAERYGRLKRTRAIRQGDNRLSFLESV